MSKADDVEAMPTWIASATKTVVGRNPHKPSVLFLLKSLERSPDNASRQSLIPKTINSKDEKDVVYMTWEKGKNILHVKFDGSISFAKDAPSHEDVLVWDVIENDLVSTFRDLIEWVVPRSEV